jgi:hypothetical protein
MATSYDTAIGPPAPIGAAPTPAPGSVDTNAMMQMFMQIMQGQQQKEQARMGLQRDALFGRHLGIGGGQVTPSDPTGSGAFAPEGLFHGGFAAQMDPKALAASQGSTAVNQWQNPQMFGPNSPQLPRDSMPQQQTIPQFKMPQPLTSPSGNPATDFANLQQNLAMYSPGGTQPKVAPRRGIPRMF